MLQKSSEFQSRWPLYISKFTQKTTLTSVRLTSNGMTSYQGILTFTPGCLSFNPTLTTVLNSLYIPQETRQALDFTSTIGVWL